MGVINVIMGRIKTIKKVEGKQEIEIKETSTVIHKEANIDEQIARWESVLKFWKDMKKLL